MVQRRGGVRGGSRRDEQHVYGEVASVHKLCSGCFSPALSPFLSEVPGVRIPGGSYVRY